MTAAWPSTLPALPNQAGYTRRPKPAVITFGTETGPGKRRRRSSLREKQVEMSISLTTTQVAIFEAFFDTTLAQGALPFTHVDVVGGAAATWWFDAEAPYTIRPEGATHWTAALKLERLA